LKSGGGKRKGNKFERLVAGLFDAWFEEPKHTFWRSVNSGGVWEPGDIVPRKKMWYPFVTECKSYKNVDLLELFSDIKKKLILVWWEQALRDQKKAIDLGANPQQTVPLLVFRRNRSTQVYVAFAHEDLPTPASGQDSIVLCFSRYYLIVLKWEDFVVEYPLSRLKQIFA
jgi:hypothetical protein